MALYAVAIIPLMLMIMEITANAPKESSKVAAYADDFTAAVTVESLKSWWDVLCQLGPKFGYYPEPSKSWLIVNKGWLFR